MNIPVVNARIDSIIRFLFCLLIFFLPYSKAIVEVTVVSSCLLWLIKHSLIFSAMRSRQNGSTSILQDLARAFCPVRNLLEQGIVIYFLICSFSIIGSCLPLQSLDGFLTKTIEAFAVYLIVLEVFVTRKQVKFVIGVFIVTALITGLDTLVQYYITHHDLFRHRALVEGYRATGGFLHPNMLGAFLTIAIPVAVGLLFAVRPKPKSQVKRIFFATVTVILAWALFLTFSRGAWMGTAIGLIFFVLVLVGRNVKPWLRCVLVVVAVVVGSFFVMQTFEIKKHMNVIKNDAQTAEWRITLWREALFLIKERPFFGHGLNTFMPVMEKQLIATQNPLAVGYSASYAHNCYIQMAVEVGILGMSAFFAILFMLFRKVLSSLPSEKDMRILVVGILSGLLAFLVHASVDINFYSLELPILFWFMAGLVISLDKQLSDKTSYAIK